MKLRIKFAKYGCMKFIGHLDVMRFFQKAMRRADIDIAYSAGYSPHQIMSFASPLGVGLTSNGEYMDIEVTSDITEEKLVSALNGVMVEGIEIVNARRLPDNAKNAMASVQWADYEVSFREGYAPELTKVQEAILSLEKKDAIVVTKTTKKGTRELDLKPCINELAWKDNKIFMRLKAGSEDNTKPELVMNALAEEGNFELEKFSLLVTRLELYGEAFVPLEDFGEKF